MEILSRKILTGERALFGSRALTVTDSIFEAGESPLKESRDITLETCSFRWKYPLWYCRDIQVRNCTWSEGARAGVWYTRDISVEDSLIEAPKNFRRTEGLTLRRVTFSDAAETLWHCRGVTMEDVTARGDYFALDSSDMTVSRLTLIGNYCFDGVKNATIRSSRLLSKDAFWNSENVTVYDSYIAGEYLGWNAKNLTFVNCTIESLQGLCYIDRLVLRNCKLLNTSLAFEYSTLEADIRGGVDSILNPAGGTITADEIGELRIEPDRVDPTKTKILCRASEKEPR